MSNNIVAILGSYRKGGIIHQSVDVLLNAAGENGATCEKIDLLDKHIEFCNNCRSCMQKNQEQPRGDCVIKDDMNQILDSIDKADGIILAAPINMYSPTAIMKRFMERLAVYAYWPWNVPVPKSRKLANDKKVVIVTSSGAPEIMVKLLGSSWNKSLKTIARYTWGSKKIKAFHIGKAAMSADQKLNDEYKKRLKEGAKIFVK